MKEKIEKIIKKNELYYMMSKHFDSDSVEQGIEELVEALSELFPKEKEQILYQNVVDYLKTKLKDTIIKISVEPHSENNSYEIEVYLHNDELCICGDFGQEYDWNELEIISINYQ